MRTWLLIVSVAFAPIDALADDCLRNQAQVLDILPGQNGANGVNFTYESRRELFSNTSNKYVWCVEADRSNQNIAEFKWGDTKNECRYLCALIEPGRGSPISKTDGSKTLRADRFIKFTRKNLAQWTSVNAKTISSKTIGEVPQDALFLRTQLSTSELESFKNDEGLIQVDKLSTNFGAWLAFLSKQDRVDSGGLLTITLPTSERVADLLQANNYEKYNPNDFVRVLTHVDSLITYNSGAPLLTYSILVRPEEPGNAAVLAPLMEQGLIGIRIAPQDNTLPWTFPFSKEKIVARSTERMFVGSMKLDEPILYFPAQVDVTFGKELSVGSAEIPLFAPRK
jgi:hypothetical protein